MNKISSLANPLIKHVAALHLKKYRVRHQEFIAEGIRIIQTLMNGGFEPRNLFATALMAEHAELIAPGRPLTIVTDDVMQKISAAATPSGLVAQFAIPPRSKSPLTAGIALADITDPGNMGTLIRSAAAMGARTVVIIEGTDPWSPKAIQASAGTIALVSLHELSWIEFIKRKKDIPIAALIVDGGQNPSAVDLRHTLLVVGSESNGIPDEWIADCDLKITLPMPGNTESLNAAVAGSIALYLAYTK